MLSDDRGTRPAFQPSLKWFTVSVSHGAARSERAVGTAAFSSRRNLTLARATLERETVGSRWVSLPDWHLLQTNAAGFPQSKQASIVVAGFAPF
ncbi:uncharacterized [Tachysurus ichikawai]